MILTINCWSSSLKYALFSNALTCIAKGYRENIKDHEKAIEEILHELTETQRSEITAIGHRVAHGGEFFTKATIVTPKVLETIESLNPLAPLHNPVNILGIKICQKKFPKAKQIAVFDTSFHHTIKPEHFLYAIPHKYYKEDGIRKYGFHGTSHKYLREQYSKTHKNKKQTIITCHLGNGASVNLTKDGKSIENSLWFTAVEGLIMGTRSGTIDPGVITYLMTQKWMSGDQIDSMLYKQSWLLALSESTSDMKTLIENYHTDPKAKLAITMFVNSIIKYVGSYAALQNGKIDAIIFSWTIWERGKLIRQLVTKKLKFLNTKFLVIKTDEEYMIAKESLKVK